MEKNCESCRNFEVQWTLNSEYEKGVKYRVCSNCLLLLVNRALTPKRFKQLIKSGHSREEHILGDFYSDKGIATQPVI